MTGLAIQLCQHMDKDGKMTLPTTLTSRIVWALFGFLRKTKRENERELHDYLAKQSLIILRYIYSRFWFKFQYDTNKQTATQISFMLKTSRFKQQTAEQQQ